MPAGVTCPWGAISTTLSPGYGAERMRELRAENYAEPPASDRRGCPSACAGRRRRPLTLEAGTLRGRACPARSAIGRKHDPAPMHVRRRRCRSGALPLASATLRQSDSLPSESDDLDMRCNAEDARAQLLLESVHHRKHDDQRRDAECDAEHRGEGDEGDEMVAPLRPRVAQPDVKLVGLQAGKPRRKRPKCATGWRGQPADGAVAKRTSLADQMQQHAAMMARGAMLVHV